MNSKNIKRHLKKKIDDWIANVEDESVKATIKSNTIVTGGALVSLLTGEPVNDYDVYFRTKEACIKVADYYVQKWNAAHPDKPVRLQICEKTGRVECFVSSKGIADEAEKESNHIAYDFDATAEEDEAVGMEAEHDEEAAEENTKEKYRPRFITSNAITLSNKIQIVTRFYGEVEEIHKNYDFAHCTCAWSSWDNKVFLPQKALECIINRELYYIGSKYPLCSIIRTRKYIERGYKINAGQYVKMAMQLNELNLKDVTVLKDQLTGVDTSYFTTLVDALQQRMDITDTDVVDTTYAMELINKLF